MAFVKIEDLYGELEIIVFPTVLDKYKNYIYGGSMIWVEGKISIKEEEQPKVLVDSIKPMLKQEDDGVSIVSREDDNEAIKHKTNEEYNTEMLTQVLKIRIGNKYNDKEIKSIYAMLEFFNGNTKVIIYDVNGTIIHKNKYKVYICDSLINELKKRLGEENVKVDNISK